MIHPVPTNTISNNTSKVGRSRSPLLTDAATLFDLQQRSGAELFLYSVQPLCHRIHVCRTSAFRHNQATGLHYQPLPNPGSGNGGDPYELTILSPQAADARGQPSDGYAFSASKGYSSHRVLTQGQNHFYSSRFKTPCCMTPYVGCHQSPNNQLKQICCMFAESHPLYSGFDEQRISGKRSGC
jgi:hypothetical protein